MLEARIQQHFFEAADLLYQVADALARPIAEAAHTAVGCLTAGGKLLACGAEADADLVRHTCAALMQRFERDRPGLAAMPLGPQAMPQFTPEAAAQALATQVRALGQPGDVLLVCAGTHGDTDALRQAVQEAHAKEMSVVLLTGGEPGGWPDLLMETDVWIPVAHGRAARVRELHQLALHALCDAIDLQLLGEADPA